MVSISGYAAANSRQHGASHGRSFSTSSTSTFRFMTLAMIFFHRGLLLPPPQILVRSILIPRLLATSRNREDQRQRPPEQPGHTSQLGVHGQPKNTPLALDCCEETVSPSNTEGRIRFSPSIDRRLLCHKILCLKDFFCPPLIAGGSA